MDHVPDVDLSNALITRGDGSVVKYPDPVFEGFPKMARLNRDIIVTEKIDGTNAQIFIGEDRTTLLAGSRTRWITPGNDNYGFARWCEDHKDSLLKLGPGRHFGEWWGGGIQRRYGLTEKRFSLFNTFRWSDPIARPACCHVVPVLYQGPYSQFEIDVTLAKLRGGSVAAPGFMDPEGIVIFHTAANAMFKVTLKNDEQPKSCCQPAYLLRDNHDPK